MEEIEFSLHPDHLKDLRDSGLSDQTIKESGIYSVSPALINKKLGKNDGRINSLMAIPYPGAKGFERYKVFSEKPYPKKYLQRFNTKNRLYIPTSVNGQLSDVSKTLSITEGEKKCLKMNQEGIPSIALSGLWNWSNGRKELIEDFNLISFTDRKILIIPDNDWQKPDRNGYKKNLVQAVNELGQKLIERGAKVLVKLIPESDEKIGTDDYLLTHTIEEFNALPEKEIIPDTDIEPIHFTDVGNATRFVKLHGHKTRYSFPQSTWIWYDGKRWKPDNTGRLYQMAQDVIKALLKEALEEIDKERRMKLETHAFKLEAESKIESMLKTARSRLSTLPEEFDRDPWLFNCQNGAINLLDGTLQPHDREDFISKLSPVQYDPLARCQAWLEHLEKIMGGNQNLIGFLQRFFGYCLTGSIDERCMAIFHGTGANGKTVTVETINYIMGDYAKRTRTETILIKREGQISNDIADLLGARFVFSSEAEQDKRLAESLVKDLTGGDSISVRKLYQEYFIFKPQFKIVLSTNHKPVVYGTDQAIWDRIKLVPFNVTIPEDERKPMHEMMGLFQDEAPGILAWMVQGCLEWLEKGLQTPEEVKAATKQYRSDMDILGEFIDDCCIEDAEAKTPAKDLYLRFKEWGESEGLREKEIWSKSTLTRRLKERGYIQFRDAERKWKGLALK
jgi:P4 family phage/plasmid primase-like protien